MGLAVGCFKGLIIDGIYLSFNIKIALQFA
jgi:hypothetical protein